MKGLEALKQIKRVCECEFDFEVNIGNSYRIIEKELKALAIIRNHYHLCNGMEARILLLTNDQFSWDQYDLLKEVLKNE